MKVLELHRLVKEEARNIGIFCILANLTVLHSLRKLENVQVVSFVRALWAFLFAVFYL